MNGLKLIFIQKKYPYANEKHDSTICWGEMILEIISSNSILLKEVIRLEWDIRILIAWFLENKTNLLEESIDFIFDKQNDSIAKKVFNFYAQNDEIHFEKYIDQAFKYRQKHGIRFALRGTNIDDVYIGKNQNNYEISFCDQSCEWSFEVDLVSFFKNIETDFVFQKNIKNC